MHGYAMTHKCNPLVKFRRDAFVTGPTAGTKERPATVEVWYLTTATTLAIAMTADDAEAMAEELVHAAARARDMEEKRAKAIKEKAC